MPLFDALESQLGITKTGELIAAKKIEVLPLAYMRGRTLDNCFIIA
jgi:phosphate starvation-inducible PhoH-like protein